MCPHGHHAKGEAFKTLEAESRRRSVEGWEVPVYHRGKQIGTVRRYSDTLLIFMLKGATPGKYADHADHRHLHQHQHHLQDKAKIAGVLAAMSDDDSQ